MSSRLNRNPLAPGNTLAEMVLIGALVLVVAIFGFTVLGNGLQAKMVDLKEDMAATADSAQSAQQFRDAQIASNQKAAEDKGRLGDILANDPTMAATSPHTLGANGNEALASGKIVNLAQKLLALDVPPEHQGAVKDMANQIHRMAQISALMEQAAQNSSNAHAFRDTTYQFDGKTYNSTWDLMAVMFNNSGTGEVQKLTKMAWDLKAATNGQLDNATRDYIIDIHHDVKQISKDLNNLAKSTIQTKGSLDSVAGSTASTENHDNGVKVCEAGKHQDTGKQCY